LQDKRGAISSHANREKQPSGDIGGAERVAYQPFIVMPIRARATAAVNARDARGVPTGV
jgi:hypothetical protein